MKKNEINKVSYVFCFKIEFVYSEIQLTILKHN